ncbi:MAG: iron-containing alcohol dehydrogenase, partial [Bacteroidota bacterium]
NGQDIAARTHMAYAAYLSGVCLANAGLGLVHGYASSVGGKISIPHGILCGSLMGVVNHMTLDKLLEEDPSSKALQKYAKVGSLFLGERPYENAGYAKGLTDLIQEWIEKVNLPRLSGYGLEKEMIPALAAATGMKNHPIEFSQEEKEEMLRKRL